MILVRTFKAMPVFDDDHCVEFGRRELLVLVEVEGQR